MTKTFNYLKREMWDGFSLNEKLFMWGMVLLQILVYIVAPDSWYGVVAGIAGCISVVLTAKGRWMMYPIGFIQNFTYTVLAFQNMFYGEVIEQVFYIVTMIWGMVAWARNMHTNEDGTQDVNTRKFGLAEWLFTIVGVAIKYLKSKANTGGSRNHLSKINPTPDHLAPSHNCMLDEIVYTVIFC